MVTIEGIMSMRFQRARLIGIMHDGGEEGKATKRVVVELACKNQFLSEPQIPGYPEVTQFRTKPKAVRRTMPIVVTSVHISLKSTT